MKRQSKKIRVGDIYIGGDSKITVQSMLNIPAHDIEGNVLQAQALEKAGCEIIRVAVPDEKAVKTVEALKNSVNVPIVADIHFNHKLALMSIDAGVDKVRINPGNIGADENVKAVAEKCRHHRTKTKRSLV